MFDRRAMATLAAALGLAGVAALGATELNAQAPAATPARYPNYPVAKRIEPIVPSRSSHAPQAVRKGVTTASIPETKTASKKATAGSLASAKGSLSGKSALGVPSPATSATAPGARKAGKTSSNSKKAATKR